MLRFFWCIITNLHFMYMGPKMGYYARHPEKYDEEFCYRYCQLLIKRLNRSGRITTSAYGLNNLPKEGGYIMFPNHQGKYDALGIIMTHHRPCGVIVDDAVSHGFLIRQFIDCIRGKRLVKTDIKQSIRIIGEMAKEAAKGRILIIFPEGGYDKNENAVGEYCNFKPGSFKSAVKAKVPIVPVALVDSYKPFGINSLRPVHTEVHYLEPLYYDDYKEMTTVEIAELVSGRIREFVNARVEYLEAHPTKKKRNTLSLESVARTITQKVAMDDTGIPLGQAIAPEDILNCNGMTAKEFLDAASDLSVDDLTKPVEDDGSADVSGRFQI